MNSPVSVRVPDILPAVAVLVVVPLLPVVVVLTVHVVVHPVPPPVPTLPVWAAAPPEAPELGVAHLVEVVILGLLVVS